MKKRIEIKNNAPKEIIVTNSVFETLTADEERIIARYENRGYTLSIVDDKKKEVSAIVRLTDKQIRINASAGSRELDFNEEQSKDFLSRYNELKKAFCFQTAKGFYVEVLNAKNKKNDRSIEEVYSFYDNMLSNNVA